MFAEHLSRQNTPKKISDILKNINLIDHNGIEFNKASLNEKPSLLFFGFTHCPEICPTTLSQLSEITENLQNPVKVLKPTAEIRLNIGNPFIIDREKIKNLSSRSAIFSVTKEIMLRISRMLPIEKQGYYKELSLEEFSVTKQNNREKI